MKKYGAIPYLVLFVLSVGCNLSALAQDIPKPIINASLVGTVIDSVSKQPIEGVTVQLEAVTHQVKTDWEGKFSFVTGQKLPVTLLLSAVGYNSKTIIVESSPAIIELSPSSEDLDEVTVVAFGQQKKGSVVSSIQTIDAKELRIPSSNLTTSFAGRIAGMISYQTSGEPGQDNANFFIRGITSFGSGKVDPLILIDKVEMTTNDLARLHPDDIQSFSILKDATATALYGARGANGVILVNTKEGKEGKISVSVRMENSLSSPTTKIEMADPITYMRLSNEAISARTLGDQQPLQAFSEERIANTIAQTNPYVYPAVDWMEMLTKDVTSNQRVNLNVTGGGNIARYYITGSFTQDNGVLKVDNRNNFNNNIDLKKYTLRSNININLTNTTEALIRVQAAFDDYNGPITGGNEMYNKILQVSPVRFPAYYEPDRNYAHSNHILFGGSTTRYMNPYAELVKGFRQQSTTNMLAQFELKQKLNQWVEGLEARVLGNTVRYSTFGLSRSYSPYFYQVSRYDQANDEYFLRELNSEGEFAGSEALSYNPGRDKNTTVTSAFYAEGSVNYNRIFGKHDVSGMVVSILRNSLTTDAQTLAESLPRRNLGVSGRFTYGYDSRYYTEFNFGYNGSEKFDKGHRWGFFPSVGVAWNVSNEKFWEESDFLSRYINKLRVRGTYGLVGNDEIGDVRFFYISQIELNGGNGYPTGFSSASGKNLSGVKILNYPNSLIGWEKAYKTNIGIELGLFNRKIDILVDLFNEHRTNILQYRADLPSTMGLWSTPQVNVGEAQGRGVDASLDYNHTINRTTWLTARANFTYARSVFNFYEEPDYNRAGQSWRSRNDRPISQTWGYIAERLFLDEADVAYSARQEFGEYGPGDIKYKDINGDNLINEADLVPIGYPQTPEINYGFGLSFGHKNLDISFFFQGSGNSSFWINANKMSPFVISYDANEVATETGLAKFIADDYWSENNQNPYAVWPRLSNYIINNNTQTSTWFMRNGKFLRLKSVEIGYNIPSRWISGWNLKNVRFYASGLNLASFSDFKLWDVEMGGNGFNYPLQRVVNLGFNVSF